MKRPVFTTSATAVVKVLKSELRVGEARATEGKRILQSVPLESFEPQRENKARAVQQELIPVAVPAEPIPSHPSPTVCSRIQVDFLPDPEDLD